MHLRRKSFVQVFDGPFRRWRLGFGNGYPAGTIFRFATCDCQKMFWWSISSHPLEFRRQEKILIIPSLQEIRYVTKIDVTKGRWFHFCPHNFPFPNQISRNPDTLSITPAYTPIQASWIDKTAKVCDFQDIFF